MPRYEYHCDACGRDFEATQRMSDAPLTSCECGAQGRVRRLMSAGNGVIFKGSGFYQTDYKGSSPKSSSSESSASTATADKPKTSGGGGCGSGCGCH
ncbi:MAG TPA: zinc ribbon domain-containing protein [Candidatus Sumerlaeota bacterium]|nr:zinc ribbon domain-containing protein [Candidatus Sumerlaeota bacterium]HNM45751.1 zinc ribbon domain-containing protein [Candidatus Sumerlaeota bacterium]